MNNNMLRHYTLQYNITIGNSDQEEPEEEKVIMCSYLLDTILKFRNWFNHSEYDSDKQISILPHWTSNHSTDFIPHIHIITPTDSAPRVVTFIQSIYAFNSPNNPGFIGICQRKTECYKCFVQRLQQRNDPGLQKEEVYKIEQAKGDDYFFDPLYYSYPFPQIDLGCKELDDLFCSCI